MPAFSGPMHLSGASVQHSSGHFVALGEGPCLSLRKDPMFLRGISVSSLAQFPPLKFSPRVLTEDSRRSWQVGTDTFCDWVPTPIPTWSLKSTVSLVSLYLSLWCILPFPLFPHEEHNHMSPFFCNIMHTGFFVSSALWWIFFNYDFISYPAYYSYLCGRLKKKLHRELAFSNFLLTSEFQFHKTQFPYCKTATTYYSKGYED